MRNNEVMTITATSRLMTAAEATLKANEYKVMALVHGSMKEVMLKTDTARRIAARVGACTALEGETLKAVCCEVATMDKESAGREGYASISAFLGSIFPNIGAGTMMQYYKSGHLFSECVDGKYQWKKPIPQSTNVSALVRFLSSFIPKDTDVENLTADEWNALYLAGAERYFQPFAGEYERDEDGERTDKYLLYAYAMNGDKLERVEGLTYESTADMPENIIPDNNPHFIDPSLPQSLIKKALKEDKNTIDGTSTTSTKKGEDAPAAPADNAAPAPAEDTREKALTALTEVSKIYEGHADIMSAVAEVIKLINALTEDKSAEDKPAEEK